MAGVNKVIIVGRLGQDPEFKSIASGQNVTRLNIATSEQWLSKTGEKQEKTEWHRVVVWGKQAETCAKHLSKGRQVYIEGKLQTRSWEDPQGQKKYSTEIVASTVQFLGSGGDRPTQSHNEYESQSSSPANDFGPEPSFDPADEIPF